jgi:predicted nuclease of predicted toxin-antitoxin system
LRPLGLFAVHVVHLGRAGVSDADLREYAFRTDAVVATINAGDFLALACGVELPPGLIVLRRSGLSPDDQWRILDRQYASACPRRPPVAVW